MTTIEQKAIAYDKAIEKIKYAMEHGVQPVLNKEDLLDIFPELAESDDEKIISAIRKAIKAKVENLGNGVTRTACLAWLEKQEDKDSQVKLPTFTFDDILALQCCMETVKKVQEDKDLYEKLNDLHGRVYDAYHLEKQGEQKPADKIEPKFKVGDWCIDNEDGTIFQIVKVLDNTYKYRTNEGKEYSCTHYSLELDARFWNIKDARDGDVLAAHECLVLFREIDGLNIRCYCTYYFMNNPSFSVDTLQNKDAFHPATKEQCGILEKAMADAGYAFDFEKKELKEIENEEYDGENIQMIKSGYEDNIQDFNELLSFLDTFEAKEVDLEKEYNDFIKSDNVRSMFETAKYFFELGLKERIDKETD